MTHPPVKIWMWMDGTTLLKATYHIGNRTLTIYDETDSILLRRHGLTAQQAQKFALRLATIGAKRLDNSREPFTYL